MSEAVRAIETWEQLLRDDTQPLLEEIARSDIRAASVLARLRREWSFEVVAACIELVKARAKARAKFAHPERMFADVAGVEQSTSEGVATHKALRFRRAAPERIVDLCCGIGGDTMAIADIAPTLGVDLDPLRAWMAARNAGCETECADIASVSTADTVAHLDPDRRVGGRRVWRLADYRPGPETIERVVRESVGAAIKLGPGIDFDELPEPDATEIEIIGDRGTLVQAVLWSGTLAEQPGRRTATRLPEGVSLTGVPQLIPVQPTPDAWLHAVDPAIERTDLVGVLCEHVGCDAALHHRLGLLTSDTPSASPWLTSFELLAEMPWRVKTVKSWLQEHDGGVVTIRTRGGAVETVKAQRQLRGRGETPYTVFVLRVGKKVRALITRPSCASEAPASEPG
jgi:hypothetical protein